MRRRLPLLALVLGLFIPAGAMAASPSVDPSPAIAPLPTPGAGRAGGDRQGQWPWHGPR